MDKKDGAQPKAEKDKKGKKLNHAELALSKGHVALDQFERGIKKCRKHADVGPEKIPVVVEIGPAIWLRIKEVLLIDRKAHGDNESFCTLIQVEIFPEDVVRLADELAKVLGARGRVQPIGDGGLVGPDGKPLRSSERKTDD